MRRKLAVLAASIAIAAAVVLAPPASAACNLHVVYTLYPFAEDTSYTTTSYSVYRNFLSHNRGVARYGWYC